MDFEALLRHEWFAEFFFPVTLETETIIQKLKVISMKFGAKGKHIKFFLSPQYHNNAIQ